jgi:N-acetylmuramoyl-L-alanine amidase
MRCAPFQWKSLVTLALLSACGHEITSDARELPSLPVVRDPFLRARGVLASLGRRQISGDVDAVVQDLSMLGREPGNPRSLDAMRMAGDVMAARWRVSHDGRDLTRALDYYRAVGTNTAKPATCAALHARSDLLAEAQHPNAPNAHTEYEEACVPAPLRANGQTVAPVVNAVTRVRRVVLDPGHGGSDPGAIGPTGLTEASVTLDVTRRIAERLATNFGVQVSLTRDEDIYVDLEARAAHANDAGADLFVSVHCNSAFNHDAHGVATFVLDTASDRVASRVSRREGELVADDPVGTNDVARILMGLRFSAQGRHSIALAENIQHTMLHDLRLLFPAVDDLGVHPAAFQVLVTARMPAVLVELSFISNPMEEQRLRANGYRDVLASAIARAIASYGM